MAEAAHGGVADRARSPSVPWPRTATSRGGERARTTAGEGHLGHAPDGSDVRRLTDSPGLDEGPVWSPDGTKIAFCSARDGQQEIYVMNADGSDQRRLTSNPSRDESPDWQPLPFDDRGHTACGDVSLASVRRVERCRARHALPRRQAQGQALDEGSQRRRPSAPSARCAARPTPAPMTSSSCSAITSAGVSPSSGVTRRRAPRARRASTPGVPAARPRPRRRRRRRSAR
jgi:hypothetical protein